MAGWYRAEADWWPKILATLPRPLEREAVLHDLRWHDNEIRAGRIPEMPSRAFFRTRWGWTEWATRRQLAAIDEWSDPLQNLSNDSPEILQPFSRLQTKETEQSKEILQQFSSNSPAILQNLSRPLEIDSEEPKQKRPKQEQRTTNNKQSIDLKELYDKWVSTFKKLLAPTKVGISKTYTALGKEDTALMIDWLASQHYQARFLRGEKEGYPDNRLHDETPWLAKHRVRYLAYAQQVAEEKQNPQPSLIPSSKASPKQAPTNEIATIVKKVMAIPNHLAPNYRESIAALGPLAPELKAIGGGTWGGLQENITNNFTRRATEQAIRELLEK